MKKKPKKQAARKQAAQQQAAQQQTTQQQAIQQQAAQQLVAQEKDRFLLFFRVATIVTSLTTMLFAVFTYINPINSQKNKAENQETEVLLERLETSTSEIKRNHENFIRICNSIDEQKIKDREDLHSFYSNLLSGDYDTFDAFLHYFLFWLMYTDTIEKNDGTPFSNEEILEIKNFVSGILQSENENNLFEGVSQDDKSSLLAIKTMLSDSDNSMPLKNELRIISNSLKEKQEIIKYERLWNRFALLVSLLGIIVTVYFSLSTNRSLKKYFSILFERQQAGNP